MLTTYLLSECLSSFRCPIIILINITTSFISLRKETFLNEELFKCVRIDVILSTGIWEGGLQPIEIYNRRQGGRATTIEIYNRHQGGRNTTIEIYNHQGRMETRRT